MIHGVVKGPEWNKRSLKMPDDSVPWSARGFVAALGNTLTATLWEESLLPEPTGLRVAGFMVFASSASSGYVWHWLRNGNVYDSVYGALRLGGGPVFLPIPAFLVYDPSDVLTFQVENVSGAVRDFGFLSWGWYF
jgi:hypothetical protein